jgi:hypothetical protein
MGEGTEGASDGGVLLTNVVYIDDPLPSRDLRGGADFRRRMAGVYKRELIVRAAAAAAAAADADDATPTATAATAAMVSTTQHGLFRLGRHRLLVRSRTHMRCDDGEQASTSAGAGSGAAVVRCKAEYRVHAAAEAEAGVGLVPGVVGPGPLEEVSWDEAAEWWLALAVRAPGTSLALARVCAANATLLGVETLTAEQVLRAGSDPPPPPPHLDPPTEPTPPASGDDGDDRDDDEDGGGGGGDWFNQGFDPNVATGTVAAALDALTSLPPGRFLLAHRCGRDFADLYQEAVGKFEAPISETLSPESHRPL